MPTINRVPSDHQTSQVLLIAPTLTVRGPLNPPLPILIHKHTTTASVIQGRGGEGRDITPHPHPHPCSTVPHSIIHSEEIRQDQWNLGFAAKSESLPPARRPENRKGKRAFADPSESADPSCGLLRSVGPG